MVHTPLLLHYDRVTCNHTLSSILNQKRGVNYNKTQKERWLWQAFGPRILHTRLSSTCSVEQKMERVTILDVNDFLERNFFLGNAILLNFLTRLTLKPYSVNKLIRYDIYVVP